MMTFTLTKKHLVTTLLITLFGGFSLAWLLVPEFAWFFGIALIIIAITAMVLWVMNKDEAIVKQQKQLEKQDFQLIRNLFQHFLRELKDRGQHKQKYRTPWYLFISHDLTADEVVLSQMGFRNSSTVSVDEKLPIQIWLKNDAIILLVRISNQDYRALNCIKLLLKQAKSYRSRQTLNGIITGQSIDSLLSNNKSYNQQLANDTRLVIDETQALCGQKLPIYVLFNQMSGLADFCQFFASLDETELDGSFGALNNNESQGLYNPTWFEHTFDTLCRRMGKTVLAALNSQLSESFRRSAIAAPMQFQQIKPDIAYYLEQLLLAKPSVKPYIFRGYFFTNTEQNSQVNDPVTKQVAYQLDFNEMRVTDKVKLPHSLFVNQLFSELIRPEAGMATINKNRKRLFWGFQISYAFAMLSLVIASFALLKVNFDYFQPLNEKTLLKLEHYQRTISKTPYDIKELATNVGNLQMIRNIYVSYNKPTPFYISSLIPSPDLTRSVKQAYYDELINVLLPSLTHYLEDELFVYETLGDSLQTAKLLNLNQELQLHDQASWLHLKSYYRQSFIKEGHSEASTLKNLIVLMDDLYTLGVPNVTLNQALITRSKASIDAINTTKVLFEYIKDLPQFSSKIDISSELGHNFEQLYKFSPGFTGKLVPFIFTPQGFIGMNLATSSQLMQDVMANNKALIGDDLNQFEQANLAHKLQRYYQRQYINYWVGFVNNITLKQVSIENLSHSLALLSSKTDAPINQLYQVVGYYTNPSIPQTNAEKTPNKNAAAAKGDEQKVLVAAEQITMAKSIQAEFAVYHDFIKKDDKGISELSHLHTNLSQVAKWYNQANQKADPGRYYFQQLSSNNKNQTLYQLTQTEVAIEQINLHLDAITELLNNAINKALTHYLNQQWQKHISMPFSSQFADKFPFALTSEQEVNFKQFNRFFKPKGVFEQFSSKILAKFSKENDRLLLRGFTSKSNIYISKQLQQQFSVIHDIQQDLYQQDQEQLSVDFKLKVDSMSAKLLNFELFSQRSLFNYQHGPKLWSKFTWPDLSNQDELLMIFTDTENNKTTQQYKGAWAWLRWAHQHAQIDDKSDKIKIKLDDAIVTLLISVESDENPLDPMFFSRLNLTDNLLSN